MLERRKEIPVAFRLFSFSSKLEPDLQTGSGRNVPAPAASAILIVGRYGFGDQLWRDIDLGLGQ